jgi:hypothetical protein
MTICTSNHIYQIMNFWELSEKYQKKAKNEYDFLFTDDDDMPCGFFIYKKRLFNLSNFMRHNAELKDDTTHRTFYAHGVENISCSNGYAVNVGRNGESLKVCYFYE